MSGRLKLILLGLFIVQIAVVAWSYYGDKWKMTNKYAPYVAYLENPMSVKTMNLSGLNLKELIPEMTQFQNLEYLDLSDNEFREIPSIVFELPNLKGLNLSKNRIRRVEFLKNNSLERVNLSHNQIDDVEYNPCNVDCLRNLKMIDLSYNLMKESPSFGDSNLDTILMSNNELNSFYNIKMSMSSYHVVEYLDVSSNDIEGIDEQLYEFIGFSYEYLGEIGNNCISLNISDNFFEYFPYEITQVQTLKHLYINNADIKDTNVFLRENTLSTIDFSNSNLNFENSSLELFTILETADFTSSMFDNFVLKNETVVRLNLNDVSVADVFELDCPLLDVLVVETNMAQLLEDSKLPSLREIYIPNYTEDKVLEAQLKLQFNNVTIKAYKD